MTFREVCDHSRDSLYPLLDIDERAPELGDDAGELLQTASSDCHGLGPEPHKTRFVEDPQPLPIIRQCCRDSPEEIGHRGDGSDSEGWLVGILERDVRQDFRTGIVGEPHLTVETAASRLALAWFARDREVSAVPLEWGEKDVLLDVAPRHRLRLVVSGRDGGSHDGEIVPEGTAPCQLFA